MLSAGGFMKQFIGAIAATKAIEMAGRTDTVSRIIDQATIRLRMVANLLDKLTEGIEEESDDLPMQ